MTNTANPSEPSALSESAGSPSLRRLHLFCPENDSALAFNSPFYTPSKAAAQLRRDGSLLPLWWSGGSADMVLSPLAPQMAERVCREMGLQGCAVSHIEPTEAVDCHPWGWSDYVRRLFMLAGVDSRYLPSPKALARLRGLSHRRVSIEILRHLGEQLPSMPLPPETVEISALSALPRGEIYVKLPWSSSGRGVNHYPAEGPTAAELAHIAGMIRNQGSVIVERALQKVMDFAMLFHSEGGAVTYRGLSIFDTDGRSGYTGNLVATEEYMRQVLGQFIPDVELHAVAAALEQVLTDLVSSHYRGWMGVDMMVYRDADGALRLNPCVELNLRMTMGVVAHLLCRHETIRAVLPRQFVVSTTRASGADIDLMADAVSDARFHFLLRPVRN